MQERIIEIIIYLLEEFKKQHSKENYLDFSKVLTSRGYTESEINLGFSWILNHLRNKNSDLKDEFHYEVDADLILNDLDEMIISADAYGYILQLWHLGLLTDFDLELIIEKAMTSGTMAMTIDDIKSISASLIFGSDLNNSWDGFFFVQGSDAIH